MGSTWPKRFPPPDRLRAEVEAALAAWTEVLLAHLGPRRVVGIWAKGSAVKPWDSPIDYVPETSDVDVHLGLASPADEAPIASVEGALAVRARAEAAFRARVPSPIHVPRPQLVLLHRLQEAVGTPFTPPKTVRTLWGAPPPTTVPGEEACRRETERARRELLEQEAFLGALPLRVVDRPGAYLRDVLRGLAWRVSPTAPRVLCLRGLSPARVWTWNRTRVARELSTRGEGGLAAAYRAYYRWSWRLFLSGDEERAGAEVLRHGARVLRHGLRAASGTPPTATTA